MAERKIFRSLQSLEAAVSVLQDHWTPGPPRLEKVPIWNALSRKVAQDVFSPIDVPGFDRASMDGFAVRAEDTFDADEERPARLRVLGQIEAGNASAYAVSQGESMEIATGAPLPKGADAVVMVEFTKGTSADVMIFKPVSPAENVTPAGSDIMCAELLLRKSQTITPREIGLLAAAGIGDVSVYSKPRVAIFSSGDELVQAGNPLSFAKVYDVNGPALAASVAECGGEAVFSGVLPDDYSAIKNRLESALSMADIVISSGSTSAGLGDLIYRVVEELGTPGVLVHGLTVKPGKPTLIGLAQNKPIFGLPGYPTSALMIFHVLVAPIVRRLAGTAENKPVKLPAVSPTKFFKARGRRELLPVQLISQPNGDLLAYPMQSGSGAISSFSLADGFADLPETQEFVDEGERLEVELFGVELSPASLVAIGSHCVGLDIAFTLLREQDRAFMGKTINVGSYGGFQAVKRGEADIAGVHLMDEKTTEYNIPFMQLFGLEKSATLIWGYNREQGLIVARGNPKDIQDFSDLVAKDVQFINRNRGSGTRVLIDRHIAEVAGSQGTDPEHVTKRIAGYKNEAKSHSAVAAAVKNGRAEAGFGIKAVAAMLGLEFVKMDDERYDFLVSNSRLGKRSVKAFLEVIGSREFSEALKKNAPGLATTKQSGTRIYP